MQMQPMSRVNNLIGQTDLFLQLPQFKLTSQAIRRIVVEFMNVKIWMQMQPIIQYT